MKEEEITFKALEKTIRSIERKMNIINAMIKDLEESIKKINV